MAARWERLCELNVIEQVRHVTQTTIVRDAWSRGRDLIVHGWIYRLSDGRLKDLRVSTFNVDKKSLYGDDVDVACGRALGELI